jgi:hypothetical protein
MAMQILQEVDLRCLPHTPSCRALVLTLAWIGRRHIADICFAYAWTGARYEPYGDHPIPVKACHLCTARPPPLTHVRLDLGGA